MLPPLASADPNITSIFIQDLTTDWSEDTSPSLSPWRTRGRAVKWSLSISSYHCWTQWRRTQSEACRFTTLSTLTTPPDMKEHSIILLVSLRTHKSQIQTRGHFKGFTPPQNRLPVHTFHTTPTCLHPNIDLPFLPEFPPFFLQHNVFFHLCIVFQQSPQIVQISFITSHPSTLLFTPLHHLSSHLAAEMQHVHFRSQHKWGLN